MRALETIKKLVGNTVTEENLKNVDCYVHNHLGLFIPSTGFCEYAISPRHTHPSYMFIICFSPEDYLDDVKIELPRNHYFATVLSPNIPHVEESNDFHHYYCIMIEKDYFEEQFRLYSDDLPSYNWMQFPMCHDILKTLNQFAFEYSKQMTNADITLECQSVIITHWLIRSLLGENYDMRAISSNYSVARAEHYIEQHYGDTLTNSDLASLGSMSVSSFIRNFKAETGLTPKEYIIEIRIQKAKKLLSRNDLTITEIALQCGFNSSAHFSSCFSRIVGQTPTEYRNLRIF